MEDWARSSLDAFSADLDKFPAGYPQMLMALDFAIGPSREIVIAREDEDAKTKEMIREVYGRFLPNKVVGLHFTTFIMFAIVLILCGAGNHPKEGNELIGKPAQEWEAGNWMNSKLLQLKDLKGEAVLVRFWTAPGCPYCAASAPALNEFYEKYHNQGLEVIGFYHHKSSAPLVLDDVQKHMKKFGFKFPVAIDYDWKTLRSWWLGQDERRWTSVSFLIDKEGIIRHIHPGGQYVKGDGDYAQLEVAIQRLLEEAQK